MADQLILKWRKRYLPGRYLEAPKKITETLFKKARASIGIRKGHQKRVESTTIGINPFVRNTKDTYTYNGGLVQP